MRLLAQLVVERGWQRAGPTVSPQWLSGGDRRAAPAHYETEAAARPHRPGVPCPFRQAALHKPIGDVAVRPLGHSTGAGPTSDSSMAPSAW